MNPSMKSRINILISIFFKIGCNLLRMSLYSLKHILFSFIMRDDFLNWFWIGFQDSKIRLGGSSELQDCCWSLLIVRWPEFEQRQIVNCADGKLKPCSSKIWVYFKKQMTKNRLSQKPISKEQKFLKIEPLKPIQIRLKNRYFF